MLLLNMMADIVHALLVDINSSEFGHVPVSLLGILAVPIMIISFNQAKTILFLIAMTDTAGLGGRGVN